MDLRIVSWDGFTDINDGEHFACWIPKGSRNQISAQPVFVERSNELPGYAGKRFGLWTFPLTVDILLDDFHAGLDELKRRFATLDRSLKRLVAADAADGNRLWYLEATPLEFYEDARAVTVILGAPDVVWRSVEAQNETWLVDESGAKKTITAGGKWYAKPVITFTPTSAAAGGFAQQRFMPMYNPTNRRFVNYPLDVVDGGLDTATLIGAGKLQASGADLRWVVDAEECDFWLAHFNTGHTKVWTVLDFSPGIEMTLGQAIAGSGVVGEIQVRISGANDRALKNLPEQCLVMIDNEVFVIGGKDLRTRKLAVSERAARNTGMAAHAVDAIIRWLEYDAWLLYGDPEAKAPEIDDSRKPVFDLTLSSNTEWVYNASFADAAGIRAGSWKPAVVRSNGKLSRVYSATQGNEAEPASVIGMEMNAWQRSGRWQGETAVIEWRLDCPAGVLKVSASGKKRRSGASFPKTAALERSADGRSWAVVWNETTPVNAATWTAWNRPEVSVPFAPFLVRFNLAGSISAVVDNQVHFEAAAVSVKFVGANVPQVGLGGEEQNYWFEAELRNLTTGEALRMTLPMLMGETLTVDTNRKQVQYGTLDLHAAVRDWQPVRGEWMTLEAGENKLEYVAAATGEVSIQISWEDRKL